MKQILTVLAFVVLGSTAANAQVRERFEKKEKKDTTSLEQRSPEEILDGGKAAEQEEPNLWDKFVFGGNASLSFGTSTFVLLAPSVGYRVNDNFVAGGGFIYQYLRWNQAYDPNSGKMVPLPKNGLYENQTYGPKFFANYFLWDQVAVGTQLEYLNHDLQIYDPITLEYSEDNRWTPVLWLEAGLKQSIGKKGYTVIGLRANVLHDYTSPYTGWWQPVIGIYF